MTSPSLIGKQLEQSNPSDVRDLLDFSVMTDLRKPAHKKFNTGMTGAETPSKDLTSAIRLSDIHAPNRSRLDPQPTRYDSVSTTKNYDIDRFKVSNPFN